MSETMFQHLKRSLPGGADAARRELALERRAYDVRRFRICDL